MATEDTSTAQGTPRQDVAGYEPRDADARWIFGVLAGMICCGIVIHIALARISSYMLRRPAPTDAWRPIRPAQSAWQPPSPRLQVSPPLQLSQFRASEDLQLTNYGWVNRPAGIVRLPIEKAMDLVLQKGLPARTNGLNAQGPSSAELVRERAAQRQPPHQEQ
jgi:hypothetical protein